MIFVLNAKPLKNELLVVTRFCIVKNATEYELSNITTPMKKIDNRKTCYIITRIKKKYLKSKKNDENVIKKNLIKNNASDIIERKLKIY